MTAAYEYVYLHGFCGDTQSKRGKLLREGLSECDIDLHVLDVKGGRGCDGARVSLGLDVLDAHHAEKQKPLRLIGSSMGGMIAATYAAQHPEKVDRVVLVNPAVNLKETWKTIAESVELVEDSKKAMAEETYESVLEMWKAVGELSLMAGTVRAPATVPYAYVEDSLQYPAYPNLPCPSVLFVGSRDVVIPPKFGYVLQLEQENPDQMKLIELDDDHDMLQEASVERTLEEIKAFYSV